MTGILEILATRERDVTSALGGANDGGRVRGAPDPDARRMLDEVIGRLRHDSGRSAPPERAPEPIVERLKAWQNLRAAILRTLDGSLPSLSPGEHVALHGAIDAAARAEVEQLAGDQERERERSRAEYLSFLVHDLKTPLTAIKAALAHLHERLGAEARRNAGRALAVVERGASRLTRLVEQILLSERLAAGAPPASERVEVRALVGEVLDLVCPIAFTKQLELRNGVPAGLAITADPGILRHILLNLIGNAVSYTSKGTVRVGARRVDRGVLVDVEDTGPGIPPEVVSQISPSNAGRRSRGRRGLGLSAVARLVEAIGGALEIDSRPGEGTHIRVTVQADGQKAAR
jgi:signal transduction histidine kinase